VAMTRSVDRPVRIVGEVTLEGQDNFNNIEIFERETTTITETYQIPESEVGEYQLDLPYSDVGYVLKFSKEGFVDQEISIPVQNRGRTYTVDMIVLAAEPASISGSIIIDSEAVLQIDSDEPFERERALINSAIVNVYRLSENANPTLVGTSSMTLGSHGGNTDPTQPQCTDGFPIKTDCSRQIGVFSFNDLSIGQYFVEVQLEAFLTTTSNVELIPQRLEDYIPFIFMTQSIREATITGRVLYPCQGDCDHSGIQVSAGGYTGLTGPDGTYRVVVNAVPIPYNIYASHEDYQRELLGEVTLEPGETRAINEQTLDAQPGQLTGLIALPARFDVSRYMSQVSVNLRPQGAAETEVGATRTPNLSGAFSFDAVGVGNYVLTVEAPGFVPITLNILMGPGEIKFLNILDLYATNTELLRGVIRLEGVANAEGHGVASILLIDTPYSTLSNADGSFLLQASPGDGRLRIAKVGYESRTIEFEDLAVGELRDLGEISLTFEPATINGTISQITPQDETELAIGAIFSLTRADGLDGTPRDEVEGVPAFISGNAGSFSSPELLGGSYLLTVSKEGYVTKTRQVELPLGTSINIDEITLELERGTILGTARRADLGVQGGVTVRVRSLNEGVVDGVIDRTQRADAPEDRYSFTRLPVGSYRVEAYVDGYQPTLPEEVLVEVNAQSTANFTLTAREYSLSIPPITSSSTVEVMLGGDLDLTHYRFWIDGSGSNASPWIPRPDGILSLDNQSEGVHVAYFELATQSFVDVVANDPGAYISPVMSATYRVDTAAPNIGQATYSLPTEASQLDSGSGQVAYQQTGSSVVALVNALDPSPASGILTAQIDRLDQQGQVISSVSIPFTPILELSAALGAGQNQYRIRLIDAAANESDFTTLLPMIGDSQAPTGTLSRLSAQQTSVVNVTLQLDYQDADSSPVFYRLYQTDQSPGPWQVLPSSSDPVALNFALTPGESGDRVVTGDLRDASGRLTPLNQVTFRYDNRSASPPVVIINDGQLWSNTTEVSFNIADPSAADNEANGSYTLIIGGDVQEVGEYAYDTIPNTLTLSGEEDGDKRLSFMWVDGAGNRSPQTETSISLDRVAPSFASMNIIEPEGRRVLTADVNNTELPVLYLQTDDANVAILNSFDPTPSSDLVSVEATTYDENNNVIAVNNYDYAALIQLSPATPAGYRWYSLTVIDAAGNRSQPLSSMMIKGDQESPSATLTLLGDETSNSTLFTFNLSVADADTSPLSYRLHQSDQTAGTWVDIRSGLVDLQTPFTVIGGTSGDRTITGQVKDASGRVIDLNEITVRYDINASNAPVVSLDNGATWTTDLDISLAVTPPVGVDEEANSGYTIIIDGDLHQNDIGVYDYTATPTELTLSDGEDGLRQIEFTWIDAAGNASAQTTEMIYVDRASPLFSALSLSLPEGSERIKSSDNEQTVNTVYLKTDAAVVAVIAALDPAPSSDLNEVEVVTYLADGSVESSQTYDYSAVLELSPTASEGIRYYGLTLIDTAGNRSATLTTDLVQGDASSPTGSISVNGNSVSNSTLFTIDLNVSDNDSTPLFYRLYQTDQSPGTWVDISLGISSVSVPFTVTAGQTGTRTVTGQVKDAAGRTTTLNSVTLTYDTTRANAPTVLLDGGAAWTTDLSVSLTVDQPAANDGEAAGNYTLTIAGEVTEVGDYSFANIPDQLTLTDGDDGLRNIRFIWTDTAGNTSLETSESISVDRVAPNFSAVNVSQPEESRLISVITNEGGTITTTDTQYLKVEDAVVAILTANDRSPSSEIQSIEVMTYDENDVLSSTTTFDYTTILEISPNAVAGLRRYELTLIDTAGNRSETLTTPFISGDQASPTATLSVNEATNSNSTLFNLSLAFTDIDQSPISYRVHQTDQSPSTWFDINPDRTSVTIPFTVTAGNTGDRVITGEIKDAAGRIVTLNQLTLRYDVTAANAPTVTLNQNNEWTKNLLVSLSVDPINTPDAEAATQHKFFILGQTQDSGSYVLANIPNQIRLKTGSDGSRLIKFGWEDSAGNRSELTELNILLDREAPTMRDFVLGDGNGFSTTRSVDLSFTCIDAMSAESDLLMTIQSTLPDSTLDLEDISYASPYELTLDNEVGLQAITLKCKDAAGNVVIRSGNEDLNGDGLLNRFFEDLNELKIYYDNIPPVQNIFEIESGVNGVSVNTPSVNIKTDFSDADSGIDTVAISESISDCNTATYIYPAVGEFNFFLSDPDGSRRLALCAKDKAGNILGPVQSNLVNLDRIEPNFTTLIGDDSGWTSNRPLSITLVSTDDDTSLYTVEVVGDVVTNVSELWPIDDTINVMLRAGSGEKRLIIDVFDDAGNRATVVQETVIYDTDAPIILRASLANDSAFSTSRNVDVSVDCADDFANSNEINLKVNLVGQPGALYNDTYVPLVTGLDVLAGEGERRLRVTCTDPANNSSEVSLIDFRVDTVAPSVSQFTLDGLGPEGYSRTLQLTANITATDDNSRLARFAIFEDNTINCDEADYVTAINSTDTYGISLTSGEGTRTVYLCAQDHAGNHSSSRLSATIEVDTTPPEQGLIEINSGDEFTSSRNVDISLTTSEAVADLTVRLHGDFVGAPIFVAATDFPYTVTLRNGDGLKTIQATLGDAAGNLSSNFQDSIYLDQNNPTLTTVAILRGTGSQSNGDTYTNSYNVEVLLDGASGASTVLYCQKGNVNNTCEEGDYTNEVAYIGRITVPFLSEGRKKVCVKVLDAAGNANLTTGITQDIENGGLCDEVTIDLTPPPAPSISNASITGVNASCASIQASLNDTDDYLRFESRALGGAWSELDGIDSTFDSAQNLASIYFDLTQDSDNFLQVRVIDKAGNTSETTDAIVEEVSSFLIPTDLVLKQTCNGGEYGILKESLNLTASYTRPTCHSGSVFFEDVPDVALLDFSRLNVRRLSPVLTIEDISTDGCVASNFENSIIDAACSPEPNQPMMIVARPELATPSCGTGIGVCATINTAKPTVPSRGKVRMLIMPDPIGQPYSQLIDIGDLKDSSGDGYALNSIDVVDWMGDDEDYENGDYPFRGLMSDVAWVYGHNGLFLGGNPVITQSYRTYVRRIEYTGSSSYPRARDEYNYITGRDNVNIHGLSIFNVAATYLFYDDSASQWSIYKTEAYGSEGTPLADFSSDETDESHSPFRTRVHPANRAHTIGNPQEGRINTTYLKELSSSHRATAYRAPYGGTSQRTNTLGTVAPAGASFFEVGYRQAWWVDADDPRVVYMSTIYGQNPMRLKYAIDTSLPIFPSLESSQQLGEPFLIYHTTGVTRGVVVAYLNENDTSLDECAE
jgi:hypothetical protein